MKAHRLKITTPSDNPAGFVAAVELDGRRIYPSRIELCLDANGTNQAMIYLPVAIELDAAVGASVVTDIKFGDGDGD